MNACTLRFQMISIFSILFCKTLKFLIEKETTHSIKFSVFNVQMSILLHRIDLSTCTGKV